MRINPILYGVLVLVVFFGVILGFQSAGIWSVSGKVDASGKAILPSAANVETIKGWMTLGQIATVYNVSVEEMIQQFGLPADATAETPLKDLESETFEVTDLRDWLLSRMQPGQVTPPAASTPAPVATQAAPAVTPAAPAQATPAATEHTQPDKTITGKTTFQNLYDWGVSKEAVQKIIGEAPLPSAVIKDFVTGRGLEFSTIKGLLQVEVDKTR
jgi:hypothetical protein